MKEYCSDAHALRLRHLHAKDPNFGVIGHRWADNIVNWMNEPRIDNTNCLTFLDYGAGRSNLAKTVHKKRPGTIVQEYDPATRPCEPSPADFVACIDVMEHVERDKIDAVLSHIRSLMQKRGIITISLRWSSKKKRKTHPNVFTRDRWLSILERHFYIKEITPLDPSKASSELAVLVEPKP